MAATATVQETLGARFRALRQARGLSVSALANLARVSENAIVCIEKYNLPPRTHAVRERLAQALGVDASTLFGDGSQEVS